jgi:hypothetical protein
MIAATAAGLTAVVGVLATPAPAAAQAPPTPENFHRLRVCESNDNYGANRGNRYFGAYQFDVRTWRGLGRSGRPDAASPAEQDDAARQLQKARGWRPWPACSRKEGLA